MEVQHVAPGNICTTGGGEFHTYVTDTGRTYVVKNDPYSCYLHDGQYFNQIQNFHRWLKSLEVNVPIS